MTAVELPPEIEVKLNPADQDEDGFVSIWNIASQPPLTVIWSRRELLAAQFMCFLCKRNCDFVVTSSTNAEYSGRVV